MISKKLPSKKQIKFAKLIANTLGINLPKENTSYAYWKFINDNITEYNTIHNYDLYEELCSVSSGTFLFSLTG